jgi:flagellar assembly protein FliH
MSNIIAKENLKSFQRWQLVSLDGAAAPAEETPAEAAVPPAVPLPTVEEIEAIRRQAHDEGFSEGRQQGHAQGLAQGLAEGRARAEEAVARLAELERAFRAAVTGLENEVAEDMVALVLDICRQVLREALRAQPETVLAVVRETMELVAPGTRHATLVLHPEDAALVREHLAGEMAALPWKIVEDTRLARGGCRVESESVEIDATLESRWRRVAEALGRHDVWGG